MKPEDEQKLRALEQQLVQMFRTYKPGPFAPGIHDVGRDSPTKSYLPARNGRPPEEVPPGFLSALGGGTIPEPPIDATSTGRRKALANWVGSKDNPLTARVMVNRIWQYHFGKGLVATPSDLGHRGGAPSHPELLDWMTTEFVDNGWSMKKLHKLIMTSSAYRQSSEVSKDAVDRDADNVYLSHFNRRRLAPEEIRDGMLQSSGVLNLKMAGRPVVPEVAREELYGSERQRHVGTHGEPGGAHAPQYLYAGSPHLPSRHVREFRRARRHSELLPARRKQYRSAIAHLVERPVDGEGIQPSGGKTGRRDRRWRNDQEWPGSRSMPAQPRPEEVTSAQAFLERQTAELGSKKAAVAELVRVLFNTNEFLYVD